jgi:hypothetical protein
MEEQVKKIKHYVHLLNDAMGINISAEIKGTLGVIKEDGNIIFTTSGPQSVAIIEAYLMGFVTALTR